MNGNGLLKFWPIGVAAVLIAVNWGVFSNRLGATETDAEKTEQRVEKVEGDLSSIKQSVARIETAQTYTAAELERIRQEQAKVAEALIRLNETLRNSR